MMGMKTVRFTRSSRKHRVGRTNARHVIETMPPTISIHPATGAQLLSWIGNDHRGRELEIVAVDRPDCLLVIHVMLTIYRRKNTP